MEALNPFILSKLITTQNPFSKTSREPRGKQRDGSPNIGLYEESLLTSFYITSSKYYFGVGYMNSAFVLINTVPDQMERVLENIEEIEFVEEAYMLYGVYDVVAVIKTDTSDDLKRTILRIRTVKGVTATLTLTVVS